MPEQLTPSGWVADYADQLLNYALLRTGDREIARDLVQDTFLSAIQGVHSFRGESSEKTWLFSILKNKIIDHFRKKSNEKTVPASLIAGVEDDYFDNDGHWKESRLPIDWGPKMTDDFDSGEFLEALQKCLARLTAQGKSVFVMKYLEELESDEVCKELGITTSNYWVMIHRAKLQLRQCLEKNWIKA